MTVNLVLQWFVSPFQRYRQLLARLATIYSYCLAILVPSCLGHWSIPQVNWFCCCLVLQGSRVRLTWLSGCDRARSAWRTFWSFGCFWAKGKLLTFIFCLSGRTVTCAFSFSLESFPINLTFCCTTFTFCLSGGSGSLSALFFTSCRTSCWTTGKLYARCGRRSRGQVFSSCSSRTLRSFCIFSALTCKSSDCYMLSLGLRSRSLRGSALRWTCILGCYLSWFVGLSFTWNGGKGLAFRRRLRAKVLYLSWSLRGRVSICLFIFFVSWLLLLLHAFVWLFWLRFQVSRSRKDLWLASSWRFWWFFWINFWLFWSNIDFFSILSCCHSG